MLQQEEDAAEKEALDKIERGDDESDEEYEEEQKKLDTVGEGNETNAMTTEGKQMLSNSGAGLAGLRDIDDLGKNKSDNGDDDYSDDQNEAEKDDYEF